MWPFKNKSKDHKITTNNTPIVAYKLLYCGHEIHDDINTTNPLATCTGLDQAIRYGSGQKEGKVVWAEYHDGKLFKFRWDIPPNKKN